MNRTAQHQSDQAEEGIEEDRCLPGKKTEFPVLGAGVGAAYGVLGPAIAAPLFFRAVASLMGAVLQPICNIALLPLGQNTEWPCELGMSNLDLLLLLLLGPSLLPVGIVLMAAMSFGAVSLNDPIFEPGVVMAIMLLGNLMAWIGIGVWVARRVRNRMSCLGDKASPHLRPLLAGAAMMLAGAMLPG